MFPVHAKCVTFDAGWENQRARAERELVLGKIYTIRNMSVERSSSSLEFYEIPGQWNTVFFEAASWDEVYGDDDEPFGGNDPEAQ